MKNITPLADRGSSSGEAKQCEILSFFLLKDNKLKRVLSTNVVVFLGFLGFFFAVITHFMKVTVQKALVLKCDNWSYEVGSVAWSNLMSLSSGQRRGRALEDRWKRREAIWTIAGYVQALSVLNLAAVVSLEKYVEATSLGTCSI